MNNYDNDSAKFSLPPKVQKYQEPLSPSLQSDLEKFRNEYDEYPVEMKAVGRGLRSFKFPGRWRLSKNFTWHGTLASVCLLITALEPGSRFGQIFFGEEESLSRDLLQLFLEILVVTLLLVVFIRMWKRPDLDLKNLASDTEQQEIESSSPSEIGHSRSFFSFLERLAKPWIELLVFGLALGISYSNVAVISEPASVAVIVQFARIVWLLVRWMLRGPHFVRRHWKAVLLLLLVVARAVAPLVAYEGSAVRGSTSPSYNSLETWFADQTMCSQRSTRTFAPSQCDFLDPEDPRWSFNVQRSINNGMWSLGRAISSLNDASWSSRPTSERTEELALISFSNLSIAAVAIFLCLRRRLERSTGRLLIPTASILLLLIAPLLLRSMERGILEVTFGRMWLEIFLLIAIPLTGLIHLTELFGLFVHVAVPSRGEVVRGLVTIFGIAMLAIFLFEGLFRGSGSGRAQPKFPNPKTLDLTTGKRTPNSHFNADGSEKKGYPNEREAWKGALEVETKYGDEKKPYKCAEPGCPDWHIGG